MGHLLDPILHLPPAVLLGVAATLVFLEDAIFVGFLLPGETAAILAGVGAGADHLSLPLAMAVIVAAAVAGDSVGYELGHRFFGPRVLRSRWFDRHAQRIARAEAFLRRRGGLAVFLARFTAFLRAMMPALAGSARMPYRRFLAFNAAGGLVWGIGCVLLGYLAGSSYQHVEHLVGRGSAIALVVVVVLALVALRLRGERREQDEATGRRPADDSGHYAEGATWPPLRSPRRVGRSSGRAQSAQRASQPSTSEAGRDGGPA